MPSDSLRIVVFPDPDFEAARPTLVRDLLSSASVYIAEGGSPQLVPGEHDSGSIILDHPYAGEIATTDRHRNAKLTVGLRVLAADPVAEADAIVAAAVNAPARSAIEWRRGGRGVATYFPLASRGSWTADYSMRQRMQGGGLVVNLDFEVAPYCHHASMDIVDAFNVDSLVDYTFDAGVGLSVMGGQLAPTATGLKALRHTARGHVYGDAQQTIKYVAGATVTGQVTALRAKWLGASDYLVASVSGAETLGISKSDLGVLSSLAPTLAGTVAIVAGGTYWLCWRVEGNLLTAEHWETEPTPMGAPTATATVTLAGANVAKYGAGITGGVAIEVTPPAIDWRYDDYRVRAFTYRARALPDQLVLNGDIPGNLPALCDLHVTPSGGSSPPVFAAMGWWRRPSLAGVGARVHGILEAEAADVVTTWAPYTDAQARGGSRLRAVTSADATLENLVANPRPASERASTVPWTTVGDGATVVSGATMTAIGSGGQDGGSYFDVGTPGASTLEGTRTELVAPVGGWVAGNVYKLRLWLYPRAGTLGNVYVWLARSGVNENGLLVALTAGAWTLMERTFTSPAAGSTVSVVVSTETARACTFSVSHTHVSKVATTGTTLPAYFDGQTPGYMWAGVAYSSKTIAQYSAIARWPVDGLSFDGRNGLVDVEVLAWMVLDQAALTGLRVVLSSIPLDGTEYGATRYSEYGSTGRAPVLLGGLQWRLVRLGRIALPAQNSERQRLVVTAIWGNGASGEIGLDDLLLFPADVFAASPMNVALDASYPRFAPSTQQLTRVSHTDGSASIVKPGGRVMPEHGLGRRIELPVGQVDILIALSSRVPDDPTGPVPTLQTSHQATVHAAVLPRWTYA